MPLQSGIESVKPKEFIMRPLFDDLSFVDNNDAMRGPNRTQPMRNDKDRTSLADLRHIPLDHRFGFIVQCAGRLIENQNTGIRDQGPRNGDPLTLPA
jgi:hypothetical protein